MTKFFSSTLFPSFLSYLITLQFLFYAHAGVVPTPLEFNLNGKYLMKINIQGKIFDDVLELRSKKENGIINGLGFGGPIEGIITVPGVFTSPLQGRGNCSLWGSFCNFEFKILAKENGKTFEVFYSAKLTSENYMNVLKREQLPILEGEAKLASGEILGTFSAELQEQ